MKLELTRTGLCLTPESAVEEAFLEDMLGLSDFHATLRLSGRVSRNQGDRTMLCLSRDDVTGPVEPQE